MRAATGGARIHDVPILNHAARNRRSALVAMGTRGARSRIRRAADHARPTTTNATQKARGRNSRGWTRRRSDG